MEAKDKAEELVNKMHKANWKMTSYSAVSCAMVCVDEIISQWEYIDTYLADLKGDLNPNLKYWYRVKQELEKMK
ncbi:hypothetical protein HZP59_18505 [Elizabethkingia anophelis]|nr:hypothetical protein [Elizabethkingia anophelis]